MTDVFGFVTRRGRHNKAVPCYAVHQAKPYSSSMPRTALQPYAPAPDPDGEGIGSGAATHYAMLRVGQDGLGPWAYSPR
jgi:hypothetical protein